MNIEFRIMKLEPGLHLFRNCSQHNYFQLSSRGLRRSIFNVRYSILLLLSPFSFHLSTNGGDTDIQKAGLKGNVHWIVNWTLGDSRQEAGGSRQGAGSGRGDMHGASPLVWRRDSANSMIIYNEQGQVSEAIYLDNDSMQRERDDYSYNNDGELDEIMVDVTNHTDFPAKIEYIYKNGQLREIDRYGHESNNPISEQWFDYDAAGLLSAIYKRDIGFAFREIIHYKRDAAGRIIQSDIMNGENEMLLREVFKYDDAGHLLEELNFDGSNLEKYSQRENYTYNDDGRKTEEDDYYNNQEAAGSGQDAASRRGNRVDSIKRFWEYYYHYSVTEETEISYPSEKTLSTRDSVIFQYDSIGNWLKQCHYYSPVDSVVNVRKICYYQQ